jgi:hypothetical protein
MPDNFRRYLTEEICFVGDWTASAEPQPLNLHQRDTIWYAIQLIFADMINEHFVDLARDQLTSLNLGSHPHNEDVDEVVAVHSLEDLFSLEQWHEDCLDTVKHAIRATLQQAAAVGLNQVLDIYFTSDSRRIV